MVKPPQSQPVTFTVAGELQGRLEAAETAYVTALRACAHEYTARTARTVAAAGRALAALYTEVRFEFCASPALFHALCRAESHLIGQAREDQHRAELLNELDADAG
jgi:hypothetical protein